MKNLCLTLTTLAIAAGWGGSTTLAAAASADDQQVLEFRLAEENPRENLEQHTLASTEKIYIHKTAIATQRDVASAKVVKLDGASAFMSLLLKKREEDGQCDREKHREAAGDHGSWQCHFRADFADDHLRAGQRDRRFRPNRSGTVGGQPAA